jgi:hypothetical protein
MLGGSFVTTAWRVLRLAMLGGSLVTTAWRVLSLALHAQAVDLFISTAVRNSDATQSWYNLMYYISIFLQGVMKKLNQDT